MKNKRTKELADLLGVTPQTVRAWVKKNKVPYHKTPTGQLYFTQEDTEAITGEALTKTEQKWAYYTRSSSGRASSHKNQQELLSKAYPKSVLQVKDSASGLNENRKGLAKLMQAAREGLITDIAVTTPDRLSRFGVKYLEAYFNQNGVTLHYLNTPKDQTMEEELLQDFMALIASFSGRFYKLRSKEAQQKLLALASEEVSKP